MEIKKSPKIPKKYECTFCNYHTSSKKDYSKHLLTRKHTMEINGNDRKSKNPHCILCNKTFKSDSGLWKHRQKCSDIISECAYVQIETNDNKQLDSELITKLLLQNQELLLSNKQFKELILEQQNENLKLQNRLIEAVKDAGNVTNVNHTTNNNNQKFNLNFFLNTTCKDAMNMSEFIENMEVNFKDIENIGKNGYVSGMTDMIVSRIKELDVTKRPMHCTDLKRETMYIKDNNEWTKDTPENTKLHQMIDYMAKQNYAKMPLWRQQNPECLDSDHPKYDFCIKMMRNMLGDVGAEQVRLDNKVIKNLSKHIFVDKAVN